MDKLSVAEIAQALGGRYNRNAEITSVCIDTREVTSGSLFIAIKGERFDGHDFIPKAFELGAAAVISHKAIVSDRPVIYVPDTRRAFLQLAAWYRRRYQVFLAAVTGSVGKTSTKDMIYTVLSSQYKTLKTQGNFNNEIGLPKTLLQLDHSYQAAVIEMGMSGFGEISRLSKAACADVGVITNIGVSHIEKLGSRENILRAKLEILDGLKPGAPLILNADNDLLGTIQLSNRRIITYGVESRYADIKAEDVKCHDSWMSFHILYHGLRYAAQIPVVGEHHVLNALAAFAVGVCANIAPEQIVESFRQYQSSGMRQKMVDYHGITVIEDCYNASPDSMQAAINVLSVLPCKGRRIAVLGDMLELGGYSKEAHESVGKMAASQHLDVVLCYGEESRYLCESAKKYGVPVVNYYQEKSEIVRWLKESAESGDVVLLKASRGMKFEEIAEAFYGEE